MKKLSIILAVVVLVAAILIGVMVNQRNRANTELTKAQADLKAANETSQGLQSKLDESTAALTAAQGSLSEVQTQLEELNIQAGTAQTEVESLKTQLNSAQTALETANAQLGEANTQSTELRTLLDTTVTEKSQVDIALEEALKAKAELETQVSALNAELDATKARLGETTPKMEELEVAKGEADTKLKELEAAKAEAETKVNELEAAKAKAEGRVAELEAAIKEAENKVTELTTQVTGLTTELEGARAESASKLGDMDTQVEALKTELETVKAQGPGHKYGLGMVTSIGSLADATAEKPGAAQVNTTVCSLVLDSENKIVSVTWDVQQTKIQFSLEGKPVDLPAEPLTKLEKGAAYGMLKASQIGKEWNEQIEAFARYAVGKTVEEVLSIPVYERDANHTAVPDVEELKASVSITVGDYLASLKKAVDSAK